MSIWQVLGFIGFGTVIGSTIQVFFNSRMQNKKLIFEARMKAYNGLVGKISNLYIENIDEKKFPEYEIALNDNLSEAYLLGSKKLLCVLGDFKKEFVELIKILKEDKFEENKEKFIEIEDYSKKILKQFRKDLFIK